MLGKMSPPHWTTSLSYRSATFFSYYFTRGVDAKAEVDREPSALREDEKDGHEHGRQHAQLDYQEIVLSSAGVSLVGTVGVPRP